MFPKKYTSKGKIIIGIYLISLVTIVIMSSSYVFGYMTDSIDKMNTIATENPPNDYESVDSDPLGSVQEPSNESDSVVSNSNSENLDTPSEEIMSETTTGGSENQSNKDANKDANKDVNNDNGTYSKESLKVLNEAHITLYFDSQSFEISDNNNETLKSLIKIIRAYPDEAIVIEGHSDGYPNFANTAMEVELSSNRISTVYAILVDNGVDRSKIVTINAGSSDPVSKEREDRLKNDRVMIYFNEHVTNNINGK